MITRCVLFLLCSIAFACTYQPDGEYINPKIVRPPETIPAVIDIDDVDGEFRLVLPTFFRVSVDDAGKSLVHFKIFNEGREIDVQKLNDQFSFLLNPEELANGSHEYDIEVKLSSGSGSFADRFGLEYYLVKEKLIVTVDKSTPDPVTGLTAMVVDGNMTLTWNKPSHQHFHYTLVKSYENGNFDVISIYEPNTTTYIDKGYVGGEVSYQLVLRSSFFYVDSDPITYDGLRPIEILPIVDADSRLKLKWNVLSAFGADVTIQVSGRNFTKKFPWENGEAIVDSLYLGDVADATLKVFRNEFEVGAFLKTSTHSIGTKIKPFDDYSLVESSNKLISHQSLNSPTVYRYNATTFVVEDSIQFTGFGYTLVSSENGIHQYLISDLNVFSFDPLDFGQNLNRFFLNDIYSPVYQRNINYPTYFSISNDNLLVFSNFGDLSQQSDNTIATIDLTTKELWGTEINGTKADISGNGNFMVVNDGIFEQDAVVYKRGVSDWEEIGRIPYGTMYFSQDPGTRLIRTYNGTTSVYDLNSTTDTNGYFTAIASAAIEATAFDRASDRIISEIIDEKLISTISTYAVDNLELISTHKARVIPDVRRRHFIAGDKQLVASGYIKQIE